MNDYGFELPDLRHRYVDTDDEIVKIIIKRDWFTRPDDFDDTPDYKCYFLIDRLGVVTRLPYTVDESTAIDIAYKMYPIDEAESRELWDYDALSAAEIRFGC